MSANFHDTLLAQGWIRCRADNVGEFYKHPDSPDSRIFGSRTYWRHTAYGGAEELSPGLWVGIAVTVGVGRSLKALRKHLGYWKRTLNMASGS